MATITTRSGKGSPLTNSEVDSNFSNINTELGQKESASNKGVANGYASLDGSGKVPSAQLPSYVDDVVEGANLASLPATGETGKIYVTLDTNKTYRWSGSAYVEISASPGSTDAVTEGSTNLYFTNARARSAISASGSLSYNSSTGVLSYTAPTAVSQLSNDSGYITSSALSPYLTSATAASTYQTALVSGTSIKTVNGNSVLGSGNIQIDGGVTSFNTRTGAVTLSSGDVTTALGYTPYNATNPSGYITGITSGMVTTALGYTPYNSSNPNGYTNNTGTVTSVSGTGTVSGLTLTGTVTGSGSLTLGGTLSLTSGQVTTALGYTPPQPGGTGASGTWGISVTGSAGSATTATRSTIEDTRAAQRTPNDYDDYRASYEFTNQIVGSDWHTAFTMQGWNNTYAAWQIIGPASTSAHENFYLRSGVNTTWNSVRAILHSGNYSSYALPLSGGTMTGTLTGTTGRFQKNQTAGDYTTAAIWAESYGNTATGIAFHISGNVGKFLEMRTNGLLYFNSDLLLHSGNYTSYSPSLTGSGASGTWGINITGNAATAGGRSIGFGAGEIPYLNGSKNLSINNPESYSGEVRLGAAWNRGGLYGSNGVSVSTGGSFIDHVHSDTTTMRHLYDSNGSRVIIGSGQTSTPYTLVDGNARPILYMRGAFPALVLDHTVTGNGSHGPTIQFTHDGVGARQWLVGTNGTGTRIDFGYSDSAQGNSNYNPHNGISGYNGTTWMTVRNNGRIGLGWAGDWGDYGTNGEPLYPFHFIAGMESGHSYLFRNTGASNGSGAIFVNNSGGHSWGIVSELRVDGTTGTDRPSLLFSTGYNTDTWSVGFGYYGDSNFRIRYDHGHRNGGWGTTALEIDRSKRTYIHQGALYQSGDWNSAFNNTPVSSRTFHGDVSSGGPTGSWWFYDSMRHSNSSNYWGTQIAYGWEDNANNIYQRNVAAGSWSGWVRYLNSSNYSSYALPLSGGTVTGALTVNGTITGGGRVLAYSTTISMSGLDSNTYYPVTIPLPSNRTTRLRIQNALNSNVPSWSTHPGGFSCYIEWITNGSGWGTIGVHRRVNDWRESFTNVTIVGGLTQLGNSSQEVIWLRGGGNYFFSADCDVVPTIRTSYYEIYGQSVNTSGSVVNNPYDQVGGRMSYGTFHATSSMLVGSNTVLHAGNYGGYALPIGGGTVTGQATFSKTDDHAISVGTIRGRAVGGQGGEFLHIYERVHIGSPSGWGSRSAPTYGLSTYGGCALATDTGSVTIAGNTALHAGNYTSYSPSYSSGGTFTGLWYFASNRNTTSDSCPLQAFSNNGSGATMSFHRGGYYAVNFGLDSDNVMRIGGWSAAANRWQLDMSGNGTYAGNVTAYSDERLKKDWSPIEEGFVDRLAVMRCGTYTRIDSGQRQAGVSAQNMREILPEVVSEDNDGTLALAYGNAAMVSAVELAKELVMLKRELAEIKSRLH